MTINTGLLQGTLQEFSLVDILQMMELTKELGGTTGAIHLKQATGTEGDVYLYDGKLANCSESSANPLKLGDVLQQLGMATQQQIEQALAQQLLNPFGLRIGEHLMRMGIITESQLKEALRTKTLWTARELALWREGSYEFISGRTIPPYGEEPLELEVNRVTMEMACYSDEWEQLRPFLPQGMRTGLQIAPAIPYAMSFDTRTLELLGHVNRHHTVRRIASAIRRPELEVAHDLAKLAQQRLVLHAFQKGPQRIYANGYHVRPSDPAEKLRMENFELLDLIGRMEQEWTHRHSPEEQLPALVEFVNWTMDALAATCQTNGVELDRHMLETLLVRERLRYLGSYQFIIDQNHINVDSFTALCHQVLGNMELSASFYDLASEVLQRMLRCVFEKINARVTSLVERLENQEVWNAMFTQFALQRQ